MHRSKPRMKRVGMKAASLRVTVEPMQPTTTHRGVEHVSAVALVVFALSCGAEREDSVASATPTASASSRGPSDSTADASGAASPSAAASATASATASASDAAKTALPIDTVEIAAGVYLIGSARGTGNPEEHPRHERVIEGFYLDKTEVTVARYRACVEAGVCKPSVNSEHHCTAFREGHDDHPINCINN